MRRPPFFEKKTRVLHARTPVEFFENSAPAPLAVARELLSNSHRATVFADVAQEVEHILGKAVV